MVINRFYFSNGDSAGSLEEFLDKLKVIDDECFYNHVNDDKNDFVGWIENCVEDKVLSKRVDKLKKKAKIISVIDKKINNPTNIKRSIISQIKEAILNG